MYVYESMPRRPWSVQTETRVATRSRLFTRQLENDQTHITLRDNLDRTVTPLSDHKTTLGAAVRPIK
jgi:hypothetical protein